MIVESHRAHAIAYNPIDHIQFEAATVSKFLKAFSKFDMIPTQVSELAMSNSVSNRLRLVNKDGSTSIYFWINRIEVTCTSKSSEQTIDREEFSLLFEKAISLLKECGQFLDAKHKRIALIGEGVIDKGDINQQMELYKRFFSAYAQKGDAAPIEWNFRNAFRERLIGKSNEEINNINMVDFFNGIIQLPEGSKPINGYKYHIDVNTIAENSTPRFSLTHEDGMMHELLSVWETSRNSLINAG